MKCPNRIRHSECNAHICCKDDPTVDCKRVTFEYVGPYCPECGSHKDKGHAEGCDNDA